MYIELVKLYARLLRFLKPHLRFLIGAVICMVGFAAFSGFSIGMIVPFTEIVLSGENPAEIDTHHGDEEGATGGLAEDGLDLRKRVEGVFYSVIGGASRQETLNRFIVAIFLVFLIKNLFWYAQSFQIVRVEQNVIRDIRNRLFEHYQILSMDYFSKSHSGTLIARITNDVELVRGAIANGIADLIRQSLLLVAYLFITGILLVLVPWTPMWERNFFLHEAPLSLRPLLQSGIVRGAVTGFGLAHLVLASAEAAAYLRESFRGR